METSWIFGAQGYIVYIFFSELEAFLPTVLAAGSSARTRARWRLNQIKEEIMSYSCQRETTTFNVDVDIRRNIREIELT